MSALPWLKPERVAKLEAALHDRILVIDGAMGTMIQRHGLQEADYRGERFAGGYDVLFAAEGHAHGAGCGCESHDQRGNNDLLTLTRPDIIRDIHRQYLEAGADLVETNTFNSTSISLADYRLQHLVRELNREGARLARIECDAIEARDPAKPRFVIGVLGPTSRTASLSPDVNRPGFRATSLDTLRHMVEAGLGLTQLDDGAWQFELKIGEEVQTVRRGERVMEADSWDAFDLPRLRGLIESAFGRKLLPDYFETTKLHHAYVSENYRAAVILTREDAGIYLDKFAVLDDAQGEGLGRAVWQVMREQNPRLFWRSRHGNPVNPFYYAESDGCIKQETWKVFWYGLSAMDEIASCVAYCASHAATLKDPE